MERGAKGEGERRERERERERERRAQQLIHKYFGIERDARKTYIASQIFCSLYGLSKRLDVLLPELSTNRLLKLDFGLFDFLFVNLAIADRLCQLPPDLREHMLVHDLRGSEKVSAAGAPVAPNCAAKLLARAVACQRSGSRLHKFLYLFSRGNTHGCVSIVVFPFEVETLGHNDLGNLLYSCHFDIGSSRASPIYVSCWLAKPQGFVIINNLPRGPPIQQDGAHCFRIRRRYKERV